MQVPVIPATNEWYQLPNFEVFRVISIDDEYIAIQYSDGALEDVENAIWHQLGLVHIEPTEEWLEELEKRFAVYDYIALGVAPGTEGIDYSTYYPDLDDTPLTSYV